MQRGPALTMIIALAALLVGGWFYLNSRAATTPEQLLGALDATKINCNEFGSEAQEMLGTAITLYDQHVCFEQSGFSSEASIERAMTDAGYTQSGPWELGIGTFLGHGQGVLIVHIGNGFGILAVQSTSG